MCSFVRNCVYHKAAKRQEYISILYENTVKKKKQEKKKERKKKGKMTFLSALCGSCKVASE